MWAVPFVDGYVSAFAADEGHLYVGGSYTRVGTNVRRRIAAFERPSLRLLPWRIDVIGQSVDALAIDGSTLYVGGDFDSFGTQQRQALAAVDTSSQDILAFQAPLEKASGLLRPMVEQLDHQDGTLYAQGLFTAGPTASDQGLAVLDPRTGEVKWSLPLTPVGLSDSASIDAFALSGHRLFVLGSFSGVVGQPRAGAAAVDTRNGDLLPWQIRVSGGAGMKFEVDPAAAGSGDWVIVGGDFSVLNGRRRHGVAAVSATGPDVAPWHPLRELGGFEATFVPAVPSFTSSHTTTPASRRSRPALRSKRGAPIANDPSCGRCSAAPAELEHHPGVRCSARCAGSGSSVVPGSPGQRRCGCAAWGRAAGCG